LKTTGCFESKEMKQSFDVASISGVARTMIEGGGYSYIHVLLISFEINCVYGK
jgi:hypothetical protein